MQSTPGPTEQYEQMLRQGRFMIQRCLGCGRHVFYPRVLCPHCGAERLDWVQPQGGGTVAAVTVVERSAAKGGPFNVVLVDLDEGPRLMSRVEDCDNDAVRIGMRVAARLVPFAETRQLVFVPEPRP